MQARDLVSFVRGSSIPPIFRIRQPTFFPKQTTSKKKRNTRQKKTKMNEN